MISTTLCRAPLRTPAATHFACFVFVHMRCGVLLSALAQIDKLFRHERRCCYWETWLSLAVLCAFVIIYSLVRNGDIFVWEECELGWSLWCVEMSLI